MDNYNLFVHHTFSIQKICLAMFVTEATFSPCHINRATNGLLLQTGEKSVFQFKDMKKTLISNRANITFLPKGCSYYVESHADCYAVNFELNEALNCFPFSSAAPPQTESKFKKIIELWQYKDLGYQEKCMSLLYDIIYNIKQRHLYTSLSQRQIINDGIDYIHENYCSEMITVKKLAGICNISETYFRKLFGAIYGTSPIQYITQLKIERAKELLSSEMVLITDVASLCGFENEYYFSKIFKKITGYSPSAYRRKYR